MTATTLPISTARTIAFTAATASGKTAVRMLVDRRGARDGATHADTDHALAAGCPC
jgi:hypothetical protein